MGTHAHQEADGSSVAVSGVNENLKQWTSFRTDYIVNVSRYKEQHDQEGGARDGANPNAYHHDFGALSGSMWDFYPYWLENGLIFNKERSCNADLQSCGRPHPAMIYL